MKTPSILIAAALMAAACKTESRVIDQPAYRELYNTYIHEFHNYGVWSSRPAAYYEGGNGWLEIYANRRRYLS